MTVSVPPEAAILPLAAETGAAVVTVPVAPRGVAGLAVLVLPAFVVTVVFPVLEVTVVFPFLGPADEQPLNKALKKTMIARE